MLNMYFFYYFQSIEFGEALRPGELLSFVLSQFSALKTRLRVSNTGCYTDTYRIRHLIYLLSI